MANQGKHRKDPVVEWLQGEESAVPTARRGSHLVDSYIKKGKTPLKRSRPQAAAAAPPKPEPEVREPGPPPKLTGKSSPLASWEHQRKLERLPQLRAPYPYKDH